MEKIIFSFLIVTSSFCWGEKYVFVSEEKNWQEACDHCKEHYAIIVPLKNKHVEEAFKQSVIKSGSKEGWIGVYWHDSEGIWKWSAGWKVTQDDYIRENAPTSKENAYNVYWTKNGWKWEVGTSRKSFYCLNIIVVQEQKTWEDALEHCRKNESDLISLLSWEEKHIAKTKIQDSAFQRAWIGMRHLGDSWKWVNGDPLARTDWLEDEDLDYQCPRLRRCGALTEEGNWENRDCEEKLSFICA